MNMYILNFFLQFLIGCCFKVSGNGLKFGKKSKQKKNDSPVSGTPGSRNSPKSGTPGSHFLLVSGILGSFDSRCPRYRGVLTPGVPDTRDLGLPGVPDTGVVINSQGHSLQPLKQQSIKKQCGSNIYNTRPF